MLTNQFFYTTNAIYSRFYKRISPKYVCKIFADFLHGHIAAASVLPAAAPAKPFFRHLVERPRHAFAGSWIVARRNWGSWYWLLRRRRRAWQGGGPAGGDGTPTASGRRRQIAGQFSSMRRGLPAQRLSILSAFSWQCSSCRLTQNSTWVLDDFVQIFVGKQVAASDCIECSIRLLRVFPLTHTGQQQGWTETPLSPLFSSYFIFVREDVAQRKENW